MGDARSYDGTVTILQPLILPLYDGKTSRVNCWQCFQVNTIASRSEIVKDLLAGEQKSGAAVGRERWQEQWLDKSWRRLRLEVSVLLVRTLNPGGVRRSTMALFQTPRLPVKTTRQRVLMFLLRLRSAAAPSGSFEIVIRTDPSIYDGRFAKQRLVARTAKTINKGDVGQRRCS